MKNIIIISLLLCVSITSKAQKKFNFAYDGNGNRTTITYTNTCRVVKNDTITTVMEEIPLQIVKEPKIYPNPAKTQVMISFPDDILIENAKLNIYDLQGKQIFSENGIYTNHTAVGVCDFAAGLYIIKIDYGDNKTFMSKIEIVK